MTWCIYLTHPEVEIDPEVPVPEWGLSDTGRQRAAKAAFLPFAGGIRNVISSGETKAIETAQVFSARLNVSQRVLPFLHENDRSATGYLAPEDFEATADAFFAQPHESVRGWERAIDAQNRIVTGIRSALRHVPDGDPVLFAGHGGVGTLLLCHLMGCPVSRRHDQRRGGSWFRFDKAWLMDQTGRNLNWTEL
ncbi:histidine phosphatase family protein [Labrenzia sp. 011]|uniref:histidine phosphatase family protein n=1 Tax=Labrenzia sp. 011 TaxID=2171494 RepID=UPI000D51B4D6|nr:histidine phosphatase family protein [Labrenzia sp. 011]PVB61329.1 histidine phosphatase family protein [Labrenzia sp. 011]